MFEQISEFIGKVVLLAGSSVAIAYGAFVFFGKKWLENTFKKDLEKYKHEHKKELESLKLKINSTYNRISKIHDKEYEIIPESWKRLVNTVYELKKLTASVKSYPNLNIMDEQNLDHFLKENRFLSDIQKEQLKIESDKLQYYIKISKYIDIVISNNLIYDLQHYIKENTIFLNNDLKELYLQISKIMKNALIEFEIGSDNKVPEMIGKSKNIINEELDPVVDKIEILVKEKLSLHKAI